MKDSHPLVSLVERCAHKGDESRREQTEAMNPITGAKLSNPWWHYDQLYRGFHYELLTGLGTWCSRPAKSLPFNAVESYTTLLTDNPPSITVVPQGLDDADLADVVKAGIDYWWARQDAQRKVALAVKASRIFGVGWFHLFHDPDKGEVLKVVHPENIWVDPDCTAEDYDPTWLLYEYRAQYGQLKALYDGKELPDGTKVDFNDFILDWKPGLGTDGRVQYARYEQNFNPAKTCPVYALWTKDPERIYWTEDDKALKARVKKSKLKYPNGKLVIISGGIPLEEKANPYKHGSFPFVPVHAYPVPGKFYSFGDIQNLMNPLILRNRMAQFLIDQTWSSGGGKILVGQASGIDPNKVSNAPIQVIPCRDPNAFKIERAPQPSRHIFDFMAVLDRDAQDAIGLHDISQGVRSQGNPMTAQEALAISESDKTRARMASRQLAWSIRELGRMLLSNLAQYKDWEWFVRIAGKPEPELIDENEDDEESLEPILVPPMDTSPQVSVPFSGDMLRKTGPNGELTEEAIDFDIDVADFSTLPASQQDSFAKVRALLELGVITPQHVLKFGLLDIPHREAILADIEANPPQAPAPQGGEALPMDALMGGMAPPPQGAEMPMSPMPDMPPEAILQALETLAMEQGTTPQDILAQLVGEGVAI